MTVCALAWAACVPELDSDESTVRAARVLAVQAEPAEATANQPIRYRALVADANGEVSAPNLFWFHCLAQKPLAELGPVSPDCLRTESGKLALIGEGASVQGMLPANACSLFGPNPPPAVEGQPPGRPVDADESGGYKLPVVLGAGGALVLYEQRISCGLAGVSPELSVEYAQRYHRNANPSAQSLRVIRAQAATEELGETEALEVTAGERVELALAWPSCPERDVCGDALCGPDETAQSCAQDCATPLGCGGQERYLDFDRQRRALGVRREGLRVSWYATGGRYEHERTGVSEAELATVTTNLWQAPAEPGTATLWMVLRDARGGVGTRQVAVVVR